jgi:hypothetical protein
MIKPRRKIRTRSTHFLGFPIGPRPLPRPLPLPLPLLLFFPPGHFVILSPLIISISFDHN